MPTITLISRDGEAYQWAVPTETNLRMALLKEGFSPYTVYTRRLNCGGRGLCATCGVWIEADAPPPAHWHDRAAHRFGYPRLSCQVAVRQDMAVRMVDKMVWGGRKK